MSLHCCPSCPGLQRHQQGHWKPAPNQHPRAPRPASNSDTHLGIIFDTFLSYPSQLRPQIQNPIPPPQGAAQTPPCPARGAAVTLRPQVPSPRLVPLQGVPSPKHHRGSRPPHPSAPGKGHARPPEGEGPDLQPLPFSKHRRSHLPPPTWTGCCLGRGHPRKEAGVRGQC